MNVRIVAIIGFVLVNIGFLLFLVKYFHPNMWQSISIKPKPDPVQPPTQQPSKITDKQKYLAVLKELAKALSKEEIEKILSASSLSELRPPPLPAPPGSTVQQGNEIHKVKTQRARMVTIAVNSLHRPLISWVGAFHTWYPPNQDWQHTEYKDESENKIQIVIYGLGLDPKIADEVKTWKNVEYYDIFDLFLKATDTPVTLPEPNIEEWRSLVIYHAVNKYGKVLYFDPNIIILNKIEEIEKELDTKGAVFFQLPDKKGSHFAYEFDSCHMGVQGYTSSSLAYDVVLAPQIKCAARKCSQEELKAFSQTVRGQIMSNDENKKQLECTTKFNHLFRPHEPSIDNRLSCHLIKRDDIMFGIGQLPHSGGRKKVAATKRDPNDKRIHVALGFPTTSKGNPNPTIETTPFMSVFLPTFLASISKDDGDKYLYRLYMGFDEHDPFFDNASTQQAYIAQVKQRIEGYPVTFEMVKIRYSRGWVVYLWNGIFQHAIENGADYFYQLNDDIKFITAGWTAPMIKVLKDSRVPDVGVAAPVDVNNGNTFTQVLVSKRHYDIFGTLYPYIFENWYSDDWATVIYQKQSLVFRTPFQLQNAQSFGTRYEVCSDQGASRLVVSRAIGEQMLDKYITEHGNDPWQ